MNRSSCRVNRRVILLCAVLCTVTFLACTTTAPLVTVVGTTEAGFACPTPTPLPYAEHGPVKSRDALPTVVPRGPQQHEVTYYEKYERECEQRGDCAGPPFPAPTPYTRSGMTHHLDEIVNLGGGAVDVQVTTHPTPHFVGELRIYDVMVTWYNHTNEIVPFNAVEHLTITAVTTADGRSIGGAWVATTDLLAESGMIVSETAILTIDPTTEEPHRMSIPIAAPDGVIETVALSFDAISADGQVADRMRIQFTQANDPNCDHPGTVAAVYEDEIDPVIPPASAGAVDAVIARALTHAQRNTPYCWGGKGSGQCAGNPAIDYIDACPMYQALPCLDCSGLVFDAYRAINITLSHGTVNQQHYPEVSRHDLRSGDLAFFGGMNQYGRGNHITHVGIVHDVDGDGTWDLIHAANFPDGTIITYDFLGNAFYANWFALATRPPRV